MFKRIVLGLDGSDESTRALEFAKKLATSEDAHVEIVHVHEYMIAGRAGMQPVRADEDELEADRPSAGGGAEERAGSTRI